jgi:hypothetical protein
MDVDQRFPASGNDPEHGTWFEGGYPATHLMMAHGQNHVNN